MFYNTEEAKRNDAQNNQIEETERKKLACPKCDKEFQDMRGLTSHARHMHDIKREELIKRINQ